MYRFECVQRLAISKEKAWDFFLSPSNLKTITPPYMGFETRSGGEGRMYAGMMITYTIRPLFSIPMTWVTEITQMRYPDFFVDEQRAGPYAIWHHEHHFKEIPGGVEMTDLLHYQLPMGFIGKMTHSLMVKKKIEEIFAFRKETLKALFGEIK